MTAVVCALLAAACSNPYEQFSLIQQTQPEQLRCGLSFDFPMDSGYTYSTAVVCRIDASKLYKEKVELSFEVISPNHESFKETVAFPVVRNDRQKAALGARAGVLYKRRGGWLDNQWGWRSNISCDTLPGRWRVIISSQNETDLKRIRAIGFTYKGKADE